MKRDIKLYKGRFGGWHNILDRTGLAVPSVTAADFLVVGRSNLHDLQVLLVVAIDTPGLQDPLIVFTDHNYHFDSLEGSHLLVEMVAVPEVHCCSLGNVTAALQDDNRAGLTTHSFPTREIVRKVQNSIWQKRCLVLFLWYICNCDVLIILWFFHTAVTVTTFVVFWYWF